MKKITFILSFVIFFINHNQLFALPAPPTPGPITGSASVCSSTTNTYSITAVAGATSYTWTLPNGWTGTSTTTSINATSGANSGNITVTANNASGSSSPSTLAVTVKTIPATPGSISGSTSVCATTAYTYSITAVAGATSYIWTLPTAQGWTGASTTNSINATSGTAGGSITVKATNSCGTSAAATIAVTISTTLAQPGSISGNASVCQNTSQTYSVTAVSGASSYTWTLPSGWTGTSTTNSITSTAGATSDTVSVTAHSACATSLPQVLVVTVNPIPAQPALILGNSTVCPTSSQTYSVTAVSGASPNGYSWTMPSGWIGASSLNYIVATAGSSGNITVAASNACGLGPTQTIAITVSALPAQPGAITGNASFCPYSTNSYSVSPVSGATSYTWTLPSGWTGSSSTNSITPTAGATGGTISVTADDACGHGVARTITVTPLTAPAQPGAITGNVTMCAGTTQNYSISSVSGAVSYTWSFPSGWSGSSTTTSVSATAGTTGNVSVTANNAQCPSIARTLAVTVNTIPIAPTSMNGPDSLCSGANLTYFANPVSNATTYHWTLPTGSTGTSTTNNINVTFGSVSGNIQVTASNTCGTGPAFSYPITVTPVPAQPVSISGNVTLCANTNQTYTIAPVSGAASYTWTLPTGWTGTSTSDTIHATAGTLGGTIFVKGSNGACIGQVQVLNVSITPVPNQPGSITGSISVCDGSTHTYSISPVTNANSYIWTTPAGWTGTSTTNSIIVVEHTTSGRITVVPVGTCGTGTPQTDSITVNPLPSTPVITGNGYVLTSSATSGNQWYLNGSAITGATSQFDTISIAGAYTVIVTDIHGCTSATSAIHDNTGIAEYLQNNLFTLFPNPSHDIINITVNTDKTVEKVYITDVLGKTIRTVHAKALQQNADYSIDVKEMNKGIYFLSLQIEGQVITKKIIID